MKETWEQQRQNIIGFGENSFRKSYYPELQAKIKELEIANNNLKTIYDNTNDGIVIHNEDGKIFYLNKSAQKLFNMPDTEKDNYSIYDISTKHKNIQELKVIWKDVLDGHSHIIEWGITPLNTEKEIPVQVSINNALWYGMPALVEVIRDFSERIRYEKALYQAKERAEESDRLKTEFINNMSHEIRTPMNGIIGFGDILNSPNLTDAQRASYIKVIQNSSYQLLQIIDDILEISRLGTKQVQVIETKVCLNSLILEIFLILDMKAKKQDIPLYLKKGLSDDDSTIYTDRTKINKILSNILENALKFTNEGYIEFGYVLVTKDDTPVIEIYVKDTGVGIKKDKQESVFMRFSQENKQLSSKAGGLGLGLSIAQENAELLGGNIRLESEKEVGSTFFITIPYKSVYNNPNYDYTTKLPKTYTILIAEDEGINYLYLEVLILNNKGINCKLLHAKNGQEAVDMCKENPEIDLVLMDLKMSRLNGYQATKILKELYPKLPIIAQTAYSATEDIVAAKAAGADDVISKPIQEKALNNIIKKHLRLK